MKKIPFLTLSIVLFGFVTCISCGYLLSTALVSSGLFQYTSVVETQPQTIFAISLAKSQSKNEVTSHKSDLQSQNGAGYIYEKDDNFYLLASLYQNINDATLVKNNLKSSGVEAEILSIQLPACEIEGTFSASEKDILNACLKADLETYKSLYDVSISLDTSLFDKTQAKLECNAIFSNHISVKTNFKTLFSAESNNKSLKSLEEKLSMIDSLLSNLVCENLDTPSQTFSSLIKLTYCKILIG